MSRSQVVRRPHAAQRSTVLLAALLMLVALLPAVAGAQEEPRPGTGEPTADDPRVGLGGGFQDAETASLGLDLVGSFDKSEGSFFDPADLESAFGGIVRANSDLAFTGDLAIQGNFAGFTIFDISDPTDPSVVVELVCPGGQHDPTVIGDLLFISVESANARVDCGGEGTAPLSEVDQDRFRGIRIFDISDPTNPQQVGGVQTCRGSHTHRLVEDLDDPTRVLLYNNGTAGVRQPGEAGLDCTDAPLTQEPVTDEDVDRWQIEVIEVLLDAPQDAAIIDENRLFAEGEVLNSLQNTLPCAVTEAGPDDTSTCDEDQLHPSGVRYSPLPNTNTCHDITAYPEIGLAAGACQGNGLLIDISDPGNPVRIDAVSDPNFSYWHSANFNNDGTQVMFTDEWGGGAGARCRESDRLEWGANALFNIVDGPDGKVLEFASYYKMPAIQTDEENCVAHQANIVPVPGRDIIIQAWYQGGLSMFDWTDPANPFEIGYFDRGPIDEEQIVLGGFWSGYWYNGSIFGSEIARGFDAFELTPTDLLSANEIAASKTVVLDQHNPMSLRRIEFAPSFEVVLALRDQAVRGGNLSPDRLAGLDTAIAEARDAIDAERFSRAIRELLGAADAVDAGAAALAQALRDLADTFDELAAVTSARLSGTGRLETAIAVSQDIYSGGDADTVILARADIEPDSLSGTPLAVAANGPLLLTPSNALADITAAEIARVLPAGGTVHLLGGPSALDPTVEAAIEARGFQTVRISGPTRIETAIAIAESLDDPTTLLVTTGFNFPDALAAGAAAANVGGAVLLTTSDAPHPAVDAYLAGRDDEGLTVFAVGGPAVRAYPEVTAVRGPSREETAVAVAETFFDAPSVVGLTRRDNFPDALAGGVHIARLGGPLLLTPTSSLHPAVAAYVCGQDITDVFTYGGPSAVANDTIAALVERAAGRGC